MPAGRMPSTPAHLYGPDLPGPMCRSRGWPQRRRPNRERSPRQAVRVHTRRGWVVLASDASHFYENMETASPFPIVLHVGDMLQGYDKLVRLAASKHHIIPGHDPLVMHHYPHYLDPLNEIVSLHDEPVQ